MRMKNQIVRRTPWPVAVPPLSAVALVVALAGCAVSAGTGTEIARFTATGGATDIVVRSADGGTSIAFPDTDLPPVPVHALDGMADPHVAKQMIAAGESMVLMEGALPECAVHSVLLAVRPGMATEMPLAGCVAHYALAATEGGTAVVIRQTEGRPPGFYTYRDGHLSGLETERVAVRPVARPRPRPAAQPTRPSVAPDGGVNGGPNGGPVNLDTLQ